MFRGRFIDFCILLIHTFFSITPIDTLVVLLYPGDLFLWPLYRFGLIVANNTFWSQVTRLIV